jgi:phosphatidylserine/phosphatidylglycerophosphate/cardiolipin synthase-like enzyme
MLWARLLTRRVIAQYMDMLAGAHGWKVLHIISPWISLIDEKGVMSTDQFLKRLKDDHATAYVVTRPPTETWHLQAMERFRDCGRVNVVHVANLHTKLLVADTAQGAFALFGSANLTQQSIHNRELGILVQSRDEGARMFQRLRHEAADIYRSDDRIPWCRQQLKGGR